MYVCIYLYIHPLHTHTHVHTYTHAHTNISIHIYMHTGAGLLSQRMQKAVAADSLQSSHSLPSSFTKIKSSSFLSSSLASSPEATTADDNIVVVGRKGSTMRQGRGGSGSSYDNYMVGLMLFIPGLQEEASLHPPTDSKMDMKHEMKHEMKHQMITRSAQAHTHTKAEVNILEVLTCDKLMMNEDGEGSAGGWVFQIVTCEVVMTEFVRYKDKESEKVGHNEQEVVRELESAENLRREKVRKRDLERARRSGSGVPKERGQTTAGEASLQVAGLQKNEEV